MAHSTASELLRPLSQGRMLPVRDIIAQLMHGPHGHADADADYGVHFAGGDGLQIDVLVDWDGGDDNIGTFSVLGPDGKPLAVGNLSPRSSVNDIIVPAQDLRGSSLRFRITRPRCDCGFSVCAIPITWRRNPGTAAAGTRAVATNTDGAAPVPRSAPRRTLARNDLRTSDVAVRGQDYVYRKSGKITADSTFDDGNGGQQVLVLDLPLGSDYELSVKLAHPTVLGRFCTQDPVGGDGSNNDDGAPSTPPSRP